MKIAIIADAFPQVSETFILNQITSLIDLGNEVDVLAFVKKDEKKVHQDVIKYGLLKKAIFFKPPPQKRWQRILKALKIFLLYFIFYPRELIKCFNHKKYGGKYYALKILFLLEPFLKNKYDVIHCQFGPVGNKLIFLKDILPRIKFLTTFHGYDIRLGLEKGNGIYKDLFRKVDYIVSICNYNTHRLLQLGCLSNKIIYHPNGININSFRSSKGLQNRGYFVITTVARLVKEKNILFALEVISSLKKENSYKFKYYLIGNGYLKDEVERRIKKLNLEESVILFGALSNDEIKEKLNETDIFFLPSKQEAFPTVLLEAQAMGVPVVAANIGGVSETLQDGVTGYLLSSYALQEAKSKIDNLLQDEVLKIKMGKSGRRFIEDNFDIRKLSKRLVDIYNS